MTLDTVIMSFGAFVAVLPFLQFPQDWTDFFAFLAGIIIIGLGIAVRRRGLGHSALSDQGKLFDTEVPTKDETAE
jgi:hypothetical protein